MPEDHPEPARHAASVDAAALRWSETHPEDEVDHAPPARPEVEEEGVPNRHSASAEAAAERLRAREASED
jgi:hypothetical protein